MAAPATGAHLGPYEILGPLRSGGMGEVYRARDTRLGRTVALKLLKADLHCDAVSRERFEREARAIAALTHPHICTLYDVGDHDGDRFLVMELLEGQTLATRIAGVKNGLPIDEALAVAVQIADAIAFAHRHHIVHRDIKPSNIMLTPAGVKLLDFGVARLRAPEGAGEHEPHNETLLTAEHAVVGTLAYMAPEQLDGRADARSDIFAFGAVLFEMLTGRRAFEGNTSSAVIAAIVQQEPPCVLTLRPELPSGVHRVVRRCLAKDPDKRWQSAADLADEFRWLGEQRPGNTHGIPVRSSQLTRIAVSAVAAVLGVLATLAFVRSNDRESAAGPISFVIPPPDGVTWGSTPPEPLPAVSPDGHRVAFVGDSQEGHGLWVRDLNDTAAHAVPGFAGPVSGLFWSSDSTRVGYCVGNRLKLHSFDGRAPVLLEAGCTSGVASWNQAGDILFRGKDGLFMISERGGLPARVTSVPSQEVTHNFPRWLPDGRRFIYTVIGQNAEASGVFAGALDGSSRTRIVSDISKSEFVAAPDGISYLLFVRGRRLVAQPIDRSTLALVGEPRVLADEMSIGNVALPSFSASPTLLVHRARGSSRRNAWAWVDRLGRPDGRRHGGREGSFSAALSPDDSMLVYPPRSPDGVNGLWMVDLKRRVEQPLLDQPLPAYQPAFSTDGRRIAFAAIKVGVRQLYVMDFPNGKPVQIATSPSLGLIAPQWSRDGRTLIGTYNLVRIVAVSLSSPGEAVTLVPNGSQAQLSPDGAWMTYTATVSGTPDVYVQRFPDGSDRERVSANGGTQPRWRADGAELFYLAPDGTLMALPVRTSPRFEAGEPTRLFREQFSGEGATAFDQAYLPTRDGQRFLLHVPTEGPVPLTAVQNWLTPAGQGRE